LSRRAEGHRSAFAGNLAELTSAILSRRAKGHRSAFAGNLAELTSAILSRRAKRHRSAFTGDLTELTSAILSGRAKGHRRAFAWRYRGAIRAADILAGTKRIRGRRLGDSLRRAVRNWERVDAGASDTDRH
jgi:hypothetical protein